MIILNNYVFIFINTSIFIYINDSNRCKIIKDLIEIDTIIYNFINN